MEQATPKSKPGSFGNATIYDIAELAGVNPSTVSRALNKPGRINPKTEERIRKAAAELNYRANPMARSLPTGRTKMLAAMIADITNPVFFDVVRGAEREAATRGYITVIAESQESSVLEAAALERILPAVDGVMLITSRLSDDEITKLSESKPLVLLNRKVENVSDVVADFLPGIKQSIEHLKGLGHSRIAFLSGPSRAWMSNHRWNLILDEAVKAEVNVVSIGPVDPTVAGGRESLKLIRAAGVTAVITYNDIMAVGLMKEAQESGMVIPKDLSIIGFDDIFASALTTPGLTTIGSPLEQAGQLGVSQLLTLLGDSGEEVLPKGSDFKAVLKVRGSTSGPSRG